MIPEENHEYFTPSRPKGLIWRGFKIAQNSFTASYLSKAVSMIMIILISFLTQKLIEFILRNVEIDPRILIIIIIGIIIISGFITLFVRFTGDGVMYHAQARSIIGKRGNMSSVRYSLGKKLNWAILGMIVLALQIIYSIIIGFLNQFVGDIAAQIAIWVVNILFVLASPMIYLIFPYIVMGNLNFPQALMKSINEGIKFYRKLLVVNVLIHAVFFVVGYLFSMLFNTLNGYVFLGEISLLANTSNIWGMLDTNPISYVYVYMLIYISVLSSLYVLASAIRTGICTSIMGTENDPETAYEKLRTTIEGKEKE